MKAASGTLFAADWSAMEGFLDWSGNIFTIAKALRT